MRNVVLTFLLALLAVATVLSLRRMVAGTAMFAGQEQTLVAIGTDPVPLPPPPPSPEPQKPKPGN